MKFKSYKTVAVAFCLSISAGTFAQKTSKKFSEKFNVNKDVEVQINASNTDIDVTTWNKNEVLVEAFIEIEGLSKKEAEKYIKKYKFEALGNKNKVNITSKNSGGFHFDNNFVIFNNDNFKFPEIVIPEIPEIKLSDINFPDIESIVIPEVDFDNIFLDLDDFDFDKYQKDGKSYFFKWKDNAKEITIKSRKDWEKFKKSKEYKKWKAEMKTKSEKIKKELAKVRVELNDKERKRIKESIAKARESVKKIDMSKIKKELAKVRKDFKNNKFNYFFDSDSNEFTVDGKKVKIKKRLVIKVPKKATFDLNTRHCKVKLPKSKASGKVSYGSFNATGLDGGSLHISFSPVTINTVNKANLILKNVTDATLASVTDSKVNTNSGSLKINNLFNNVDLTSSFGDVKIVKVDPSVTNLLINLQHSDAVFNFLDFKDRLIINTNGFGSKIVSDTQNKKTDIHGSFVIKTANNLIKILGNYSELLLKK